MCWVRSREPFGAVVDAVDGALRMTACMVISDVAWSGDPTGFTMSQGSVANIPRVGERNGGTTAASQGPQTVIENVSPIRGIFAERRPFMVVRRPVARTGLHRDDDEVTVYIFNRYRITHPASATEARSYAVEIAKKASAVTGRPVTPFEALMGGPAGGISWSVVVKDLADLFSQMGKLDDDASYQKLLASGASLWASNAETGFNMLVANNLESSDLDFYISTTAVPVAGRVADAVAFGIKMQKYTQDAGFAGAFCTNTYGPYGEVTFLGGAATIGEVDKFNQFAITDPGFSELLGEATPLFVEGVSVNRLIHRLS